MWNGWKRSGKSDTANRNRHGWLGQNESARSVAGVIQRSIFNTLRTFGAYVITTYVAAVKGLPWHHQRGFEVYRGRSSMIQAGEVFKTVDFQKRGRISNQNAENHFLSVTTHSHIFRILLTQHRRPRQAVKPHTLEIWRGWTMLQFIVEINQSVNSKMKLISAS